MNKSNLLKVNVLVTKTTTVCTFKSCNRIPNFPKWALNTFNYELDKPFVVGQDLFDKLKLFPLDLEAQALLPLTNTRQESRQDLNR